MEVIAAVAPGYSNTHFLWQRNGIDLSNGPGGSSPMGGTVEGASGDLESKSMNGVIKLVIRGVRHDDAGTYTLVVSGPCGGTVSLPAEVFVRAHRADLNADGLVDDSDFAFFVVEYDELVCPATPVDDTCEADFNEDRLVDDSDFVIFVAAYNAMIL